MRYISMDVQPSVCLPAFCSFAAGNQKDFMGLCKYKPNSALVAQEKLVLSLESAVDSSSLDTTSSKGSPGSRNGLTPKPSNFPFHDLEAE